MFRSLPRTVIALGVVSLLTDVASEMVYPLLPLLLVGTLGASAAAIGLVEGAAESAAAALKLVAGTWSDRVGRRRPFVLWGYGVSSVARPLIGLVASWPAVLVLRVADRLGKGTRGAPRDALIAEAVPAARRGEAFGFHRAMDHAGALVGPLAAAVLLDLAGVGVRELFLWTALPGALVVAVAVAFVREPPTHVRAAIPRAPLRSVLASPGPFRRLLGARTLFALANSADAFLLLLLAERGLTAAEVALLWGVHNGVKMVAAAVGGGWADRRGRRAVLTTGWVVYAAVYAGFAVAGSLAVLVPVFLVYGVALGLAEPAEKALAAGLVDDGTRGAAFGALHGLTALAALPASAVFGAVWTWVGAPVAFGVGAALAAAAVAALQTVNEGSSPDQGRRAVQP